MLEFLAEFLAEFITALYNKSLQSGEAPQDWRKTIISTIFNKGPGGCGQLPPCEFNFCYM